nr:NADH-ubiquinone oxidoreductase [Ipomoea batatas]
MAGIDMKKRKPNKKPIIIPKVTLASIESLAIPLVQEVVFLADYRCARCQKRVAEVMSKMNGETESVVVSVLEKKITVTCKIPRVKIFNQKPPPAAADVSIFCNPINKVASVFLAFFHPSRTT